VAKLFQNVKELGADEIFNNFMQSFTVLETQFQLTQNLNMFAQTFFWKLLSTAS